MICEEILLTDIDSSNSDFNSRGNLDSQEVLDLITNIRTEGLIHPVTVTKHPNPEQGKPYLLLAGYRRFRAFEMMEREKIPAIIRNDIDSETRARIFNISENLTRRDLNLVQEANAVHSLKELNLTMQDVADSLGVSFGWVQTRCMIYDLPDFVQASIVEDKLTHQQIRSMHKFKNDPDKLKAIIDKMKKARNANITYVAKTSKRYNVKKRKRTPSEIFGMTEHILTQLPSGLYTRALAWAACYITDEEFYEDLEAYADSLGKTFNRPLEKPEE